jgi:hypothetical protein
LRNARPSRELAERWFPGPTARSRSSTRLRATAGGPGFSDHVDSITLPISQADLRAGLVVLHPPTVAGARSRCGIPTAPPPETTFPVDISPHQPALNASGSTGGLRASMRA